MKCATCKDEIKFQEFTYQVKEYPYNPEWSPTIVRAGAACCVECLICLIEKDEK